MALSFTTEETPAGGFETITVSNTAGGIGITASLLLINLTGGTHKRAVKAFVSVETQSLRCTWDGTAPTATAGHLLAAGDTLQVEGEQNVSKLKMIRTGGSDSTAMVTVYYNL